jgi:hypothetical protein
MRRIFWRILLAAAGLALAAQPAGATQQIGGQTVVDFEEVSPGTGDIYYSGLDTHVLGGTVETAAAAGVTAHSGNNVYVGSTISTQQTDGDFNFTGIDLWPAIGAYVSPGSAVVTATFYAYSPDNRDLEKVGSVQTSGGSGNQFLSWTWDGNPNLSLIDVTFSSDATFAVDDILLGLPDQAPGIPEPGVWAIMLLGFLGTGAALRRRRPSPAAT